MTANVTSRSAGTAARRAAPSYLWLLVVPALLVILIVILGRTLHSQVTREVAWRYEREQLILASEQAARLAEIFRHIQFDLEHAAADPVIRGGSEPAIRALLRELHAHYADIAACASVQDESGIIRFAEGPDRSGEGSSIRDQPHIKEMFARRHLVLSGSFFALEGYYAVSCHAPVLVDGEVRGSVGLLVKWDAFSRWFVEVPITLGSATILIDDQARVVCSERAGYVGRPLAKLPRILADDKPVPQTRFFERPDTAVLGGPFFDSRRFIAAMVPVPIAGRRYALISCAPYDEVTGPLTGFSRLAGLLVFSALAVVVGSFLGICRLFIRDRKMTARFTRDLSDEIAERRRTEQDLREREAFNRALFEHNPLDAIVVDRQARIVAVNLAKRRSGDRVPRPGEIMYRDYAGKHDIDMHRELMEVMRTGIPKDFPERRYGNKVLAVTISPFPQGAIIISRDVTEQKQLEEQLMQSAKLEAIGQLAGGIAHDFNNQLAGIMGYADILRRRMDDEELRGYAQMIVNATTKSAEMTRQLLSFARKGRTLSVPVDLHEIIRNVMVLLEHSVDRLIAIKGDLRADRAVTVGDPAQIENALLNIALNARDAIPTGGTITFSTRVRALDPETCRHQPYDVVAGDFIEVAVSDNGSGMDEQVRQRVFEPFFTTKEKGQGTGMGMAAVYGTVKSHRALIDIESEPGQGTVVRICFPLSSDEEVAATAAADQPLTAGAAHVLVVDDEDIVRASVGVALKAMGYRVTLRENGVQALAFYREHWREVDLVLLDMGMPEMDGHDTFRQVKRINPGVRVVVFSGYAVNSKTQAILDGGALAFVQKPFRLSDLSRAVADALARDPAPAS